MSSAIELSIIVCSYNTREETLACLESIDRERCGLSVEIIVVDNASSDGSVESIAERFPHVILKALDTNVGFAAANNLGGADANGEYLLLLNPDTVLLEGALRNIVEFARAHPKAGIYGGRTFFADMTLNANSCHGAPTVWSQICKGTGLSAIFRRWRVFDPEGLGGWQRDSVREVECITGCFLLIQRSLWEKLGGFDCDFFMYGEDTDLCLRARKLGARPLLCPDARLIHYGGRSEAVRSEKIVRLFRAKQQLFKKHWNQRAVRFGELTLVAWAFTRYVALAFVGVARPEMRIRAQEWKVVFDRRHEYCDSMG